MSMAWETTEEDIAKVLAGHFGFADRRWTDLIERALEACEGEESRIEKAALRGDDMDEQMDYALAEIREILIEAGVIEEGPLSVRV